MLANLSVSVQSQKGYCQGEKVRVGDRRETHPVIVRPESGIVHPAEVWRVIALGETSLTPSMMSISPVAGQLLVATSQAAGQVPHP
jgi:hypothetical protein